MTWNETDPRQLTHAESTTPPPVQSPDLQTGVRDGDSAYQAGLHALSSDFNDLVVTMLDYTAFLDRKLDEVSSILRRVEETTRVQADVARYTASQMSGSETRQHDASEMASRALIAAHDQLGIVVQVAGDHAEVVRGQRMNLANTLRQLGVVQLIVKPGEPFDGNLARASPSTVPATDRSQHGRIARIHEDGWARADGSRVLRLPLVGVFEWVDR